MVKNEKENKQNPTCNNKRPTMAPRVEAIIPRLWRLHRSKAMTSAVYPKIHLKNALTEISSNDNPDNKMQVRNVQKKG